MDPDKTLLSSALNKIRSVANRLYSQPISPIPQRNFISGITGGLRDAAGNVANVAQGFATGIRNNVTPYIKMLGAAGTGFGAEGAIRASNIGALPDPIQMRAAQLGTNLAQQSLNLRQGLGMERRGTATLGKGLFATVKPIATIAGLPLAATPAGAAGLGVSGTLGGALAKIQGQNVAQGVGKGLQEGLSTLAVTNVTNPLIAKTIGNVAPRISGIGAQIAGRTIGGVGNVIEDEILSRLNGVAPGMGDRALSLGVGALLTGGVTPKQINEFAENVADGQPPNVKSQVKKYLRDIKGRFTKEAEQMVDRVVTVKKGKQVLTTFKNKGKNFVPSGSAYGLAAGFETETDEKGNTRIKYNPTKGLVGFAGLSIAKSLLDGGKSKSSGSDILKAEDIKNPQNPYYNVKRMGLEPQAKQEVKETVENIKPQVEQVVGKKMSHEEVIDYAAKHAEMLEKTIGRDETLRLGAMQLNLRNKLAAVAQKGTIDQEFIDTLIQDKAFSTNIARLLEQRRIVSSPTDRSALNKIVENILKQNENIDEILSQARNIDWNDAEAVANFYRQYVKPKTSDWINLLRYNSMLSSPNTHINNIFGNLINSAVIAPVEKTLTGAIDFLGSKITGKQRQAFAGEGIEYTKGYVSNLGNAARRFADVARGRISIKNLDVRSIPLATTGLKGKIAKKLSYPMRLLEAQDQFFQTLTKGGEESALSFKQAKGVDVGDIAETAQKKADYRLFRQDLFSKDEGKVLNAVDSITKLIEDARNNQNSLVSNVAQFTLPFVRTPMNILKQGLEYSPFGIATLPGAKNKTEQLSKVIIGSSAAMMTGMLVASGRTTWAEPTDQKKKQAFRAAGMQPYAVKIGDKWVSYTKLPPALSFPIAFTAALQDAKENKVFTEGQIDVILDAVSKYGNFFADQSYLRNIGDLIASTKGDVESKVRFVSNYPQQLVPFRALLGWFARLTDPYQRQVSSDVNFLERQVQELMKQIPWLSQKVPARMDEMGEPIPNQNKELNALSPLRVTTEVPDRKQIYDLYKGESLLNRNLKAAESLIEQGKEVPPNAFTVQAAEEAPQTPQINNKMIEIQEKVAKKKLEFSNEKLSRVGTKIFYKDDAGDIKSIDTAFEPTKPMLTGQKDLDDRLISKYKSEITKKINDIVNMFLIGQLSQEEANNLIATYKGVKEIPSNKGSGVSRPKKAKKAKLPKLKIKKLKVKKIKTPKIKLVKPKIKKVKIK